MTHMPQIDPVLQKVIAIQANVDGYFENYRKLSGQHLQCSQGCSQCCQVELTVFRCEALRILDWVEGLSAPEKLALRSLLAAEESPPGPDANGKVQGACVFLKNQSCSIYPARPTVCRSQGAILHLGKFYDVCPLNFQEEGSLLPARNWLHLERLNQALASVQRELEERDSTFETRISLKEVHSEVLKKLTAFVGAGGSEFD